MRGVPKRNISIHSCYDTPFTHLPLHARDASWETPCTLGSGFSDSFPTFTHLYPILLTRLIPIHLASEFTHYYPINPFDLLVSQIPIHLASKLHPILPVWSCWFDIACKFPQPSATTILLIWSLWSERPCSPPPLSHLCQIPNWNFQSTKLSTIPLPCWPVASLSCSAFLWHARHVLVQSISFGDRWQK